MPAICLIYFATNRCLLAVSVNFNIDFPFQKHPNYQSNQFEISKYHYTTA